MVSRQLSHTATSLRAISEWHSENCRIPRSGAASSPACRTRPASSADDPFYRLNRLSRLLALFVSRAVRRSSTAGPIRNVSVLCCMGCIAGRVSHRIGRRSQPIQVETLHEFDRGRRHVRQLRAACRPKWLKTGSHRDLLRSQPLAASLERLEAATIRERTRPRPPVAAIARFEVLGERVLLNRCFSRTSSSARSDRRPPRLWRSRLRLGDEAVQPGSVHLARPSHPRGGLRYGRSTRNIIVVSVVACPGVPPLTRICRARSTSSRTATAMASTTCSAGSAVG